MVLPMKILVSVYEKRDQPLSRSTSFDVNSSISDHRGNSGKTTHDGSMYVYLRSADIPKLHVFLHKEFTIGISETGVQGR
jgi:hypothetical protein